MKKWIENLLALQDVDMQIINLKMRLKMLPKEIKDIQNKIQREEEILHNAKGDFQHTELAIKQTESAINQLNEKISHLQQQSSMVKKNTEFKAMLSEIDQFKEKISEKETEEILLLDQLEEHKNNFKAKEKQFEADKSNLLDEVEELKQMEVEIKEQIENLQNSRKDFECKIESNVLGLYKRLLAKGTPPMVKVNASGICGSCHLKITPQTWTEAKKGAVISCDNCSHLIYLND
ncbi:hypothetical protein P0136_07465 [Lentisphaerota bacterium ZTH]|nr:hypothetical protein JYG24_01420 [Lentisphaerota bacterium]WET05207.1 hypothetical protein P0136_07465 [Lentisphaerota bacterium ZTH]